MLRVKKNKPKQGRKENVENIALLLAFPVFLMCVVLFNPYLILRSQKKIYKHLTQEHTYSTADAWAAADYYGISLDELVGRKDHVA